jgi:hypothetical protein
VTGARRCRAAAPAPADEIDQANRNFREVTVNEKPTNGRAHAVTRWLTGAYLTFVGGFAGWCGAELWAWPNVALVVLIPAVFALLFGAYNWLPNRIPALLLLDVVLLPLFAGVVIGGMGLLLALGVIEVTGAWGNASTRAATGAIAVALTVILTWVLYRPGDGGANESGK